MSFWSESYGFIKEVYDTRLNKMVEWMDNVEMAIKKVMANKVYTSAEFRRERDNFLSLCKNLEKSETRKWMAEVKETLFRDRNVEERKEEHVRLEQVVERHQTLIPKVKETQLNSEVFWKCYEYGDDLIQIFEFIDDQRAKSVRDILMGDPETTEEIIDKHASIMRIMENKRKTVEDFINKGEELMKDPKSPKFLENHVNKLKEAWNIAGEVANTRKKLLADNLESWKIFETKKIECAKMLDLADSQIKLIKKNFNLERGPSELKEKSKTAANTRAEVEDLFSQTDTANNILQLNLPLEMKDGMNAQVKVLRDRLVVLENTDTELARIDKFNMDLQEFDNVLTVTTEWIRGEAKEKLSFVRTPEIDTLPPDPEERVGKILELSEDLDKRAKTCSGLEEKKEELFPGPGEKVPKDAKEFLERLKALREDITVMEGEVNKDFSQYSTDVRFYAEYQTGLLEFYPTLLLVEETIGKGIAIPQSLDCARKLKFDTDELLMDLNRNLQVLENAGVTAKKMTFHAFCINTIDQLRARCAQCDKVTREWLSHIDELVNTWSQLEGRVESLGQLVSVPEQVSSDIPIEQLEEQLVSLKTSFKEKQELVLTMEQRCSRSELDPRLLESNPLNMRRLTLAPSRKVSIRNEAASAGEESNSQSA